MIILDLLVFNLSKEKIQISIPNWQMVKYYYKWNQVDLISFDYWPIIWWLWSASARARVFVFHLIQCYNLDFVTVNYKWEIIKVKCSRCNGWLDDCIMVWLILLNRLVFFLTENCFVGACLWHITSSLILNPIWSMFSFS